jgi:hypothetical protein
MRTRYEFRFHRADPNTLVDGVDTELDLCGMQGYAIAGITLGPSGDVIIAMQRQVGDDDAFAEAARSASAEVSLHAPPLEERDEELLAEEAS